MNDRAAVNIMRGSGQLRPARVVLIRPPSVVARFALTLDATPPIGVAYLAAALLRDGHEVTCIDAVGDDLDTFARGYAPDLLVRGTPIDAIARSIDSGTDLVGISCMFSHEWPLVRELIKRIRARHRDVTIVLGGEHATAAPELCLRQCEGLDACAVGEGEETVVALACAAVARDALRSVAGLVLRDADGGCEYTPARGRMREVGAIARPAWGVLPLERYLERGLSFGVDRGRTVPILATRGCPYSCTFCSSPRMWTTRYSARSPADVVDEIRTYRDQYGATNIDFYDLTAVIDRRWILVFCDAMIEAKLDVSWQLPSGTRSEAMDREVCAKMYRAGCRNVSYAPESGSERTLRAIKKKVDLRRMLSSMRAAVDAGMNVKANILIGFPHEHAGDLTDTLRFIWSMARTGVHDVSVWTFSPYPGSELFEQIRSAGAIPALDDAYFASLVSYSNVAGAVSYCPQLDARALHAVRIAGLSLFYGASYALHPARPWRSVMNVARGRLESRLEMSLLNLLKRLRSNPSRPAAANLSCGDGHERASA